MSYPSDKSLESWIWDAACSIRGAQEAPKFKDFILPLIFTKRLCDVFDDELNRIAAEVGTRAKAFKLVERDHKLVRFYLPLKPADPAEPVWSVIRKLTGKIGETLTGYLHDIARANPALEGIIDRMDFNATTRGEPVIQTEIGPVPQSWKLARLGEILREPLRNGHSAKETADPRGIRTLTLTAITRADFSPANTKTTVAVADKVWNLWLRCGDVFIERANTLDYVGLAALYEGPDGFAIFPDLLVRVRVREGQVSPKVLCEYLISPRCRTYFQMNAKGTAGNFPKIDQGIIENLQVPVPSSEEQAEIERAARTLDSKHATHTNLRTRLKDLFRTLLHQLMTAQVRVHDLDLTALRVEAASATTDNGAAAGRR